MIKSPCVSICILEEGDSGDSKDDYCIGCFRSVREIQGWYDYTDEEREKIMAELPEREETLS
jgi:predicted Fe-S protein YdhL (DUF1289 family)